MSDAVCICREIHVEGCQVHTMEAMRAYVAKELFEQLQEFTDPNAVHWLPDGAEIVLLEPMEYVSAAVTVKP